jgi:hypothetical protein
MKAKIVTLAGLIPEFPEDSFTLQHWIWAFTILFSRAIRLQSVKEGETLALVPYADFINHSPFSTAYIDARESGSWLFKDGDQEVILYADRGYRKMEQVRISKSAAQERKPGRSDDLAKFHSASESPFHIVFVIDRFTYPMAPSRTRNFCFCTVLLLKEIHTTRLTLQFLFGLKLTR